MLCSLAEDEFNDGYCDISSVSYTDVEIQDRIPTLVVFWSHTCGPAVKAIDAIFNKIAQWQREMKFQVMIVEISDKKFIQKAKSIAKGHEWNKKIIDVYNVRGTYEESGLKIKGVPYYQVLDHTWKIKHESSGYTKNGNQIHQLYHALKDCQ